MAIDNDDLGAAQSPGGSVTRTFATSEATKFELIGPGTALVSQGVAATLTLTMPQADQEHIEIKIDGGTLKVAHHGGLIRHREPAGPLVYELTVPLVSELRLSHGLAAEASGIDARDLTVELKDGSSLSLAQLRASEIEAKLAGRSRLIASGAVVKQKIKLGDGSTYHGSGLDSESAEVDAAGGSEATVRATKAIKVKAADGSTVSYGGQKIDLNVQTSGGSEIHRATM